MDFALIVAVAFGASALTFFSGFGLGTLLLPAFALFIPAPQAVGATAVVHLANNLAKFGLMARHADRTVLARFAPWAILASFAGAITLAMLSGRGDIVSYTLGTRQCRITLVGVVVGVLMIAFSAWELAPKTRRIALHPRWLPAGGLISGFFGGLSGHQGALRSAFLSRCDLTKEAFIGTGVTIAVAIDISRLLIYGAVALGLVDRLLGESAMKLDLEFHQPSTLWLTIAGCCGALMGTLLGKRILKKTTIAAVHLTVGILLLLLGIAMITGVI